MRVLLTNDDGIGAEGLHALRRALAGVDGIETHVIVPDSNRSATARSITTRSPALGRGGHAGRRWDRLRDGRDARRLRALRRPGPGRRAPRPDRLGDQPRFEPGRRHHLFGHGGGGSGGDRARDPGDRDLAAVDRPRDELPARPPASTSPSRRASAPSWSRLLAAEPLPAGTLLNVNCPAGEPKGIEVTRLGKRLYNDELRLVDEDGDGRRRYRIYGFEPSFEDEPGTDLAAVARGRISLTPVHFDLTDREGLGRSARMGPRSGARGLRDGRRRRHVSPASPGKRAEELRRQIAHHDQRYYVLDDPEIGDDAYDALLDELRGARGGAPRASHPRFPDAARRRPAAGQVRAGPPRRADALAGQRPRPGGVPGLGEPASQSPAAARHPARRAALRLGAEDRRPGDLARLRGRRVRARRDARRRGDRRGRDPEPAHDQGDSAADRRRARASRGSRRGLPPARRVRRAERGSRRGGGVRHSPIPETPPPARSGSSTPGSPPRGRSRSGATGSAATRGIDFASHSEELEWLREHGFKVNGETQHHDTADEVVARCLGGRSGARRSTSRSTEW